MDSSRLSKGSSKGERDNMELIGMLKGIIKEQEVKIAELEN